MNFEEILQFAVQHSSVLINNTRFIVWGEPDDKDVVNLFPIPLESEIGFICQHLADELEGHTDTLQIQDIEEIGVPFLQIDMEELSFLRVNHWRQQEGWTSF